MKSRNITPEERVALRQRIEAAGVSQYAAAALIYTPGRTMQEWLSGRREMHRAIYERLLQRLSARGKIIAKV